jgi:hypothetical protein
METNEKTLKPEESLQIIEKMIQRTKGNLHDSSFYFLLWGWIILIEIIGQLCIKHFTSFSKPYMMWLIVIPGFIASAIYGARNGHKKKSSTHLDRVNFMVWIAFFVSYVIVIISMKEFNYNIGIIIYLLAGNATFLTGIIIKFKPLIWGGIVFWIGTLCYLFIPNNYIEFISPLIIIFGYLVPGYLLRMQNKKNA